MRTRGAHLNLILAVTAVLFYSAACTPSAGSDTLMPDSPTALSYLALGDSYTIGESVAEPGRWPEQLASQLKSNNINVNVTIVARTGWTTDELSDGIQTQGIVPSYDLVSLLIGVNNQYRGRGLDEYREQFRFLLNKAIEYAGDDAHHVIVVSIPDWGVTPFAEGRDRAQIAADIDAFNAVNKDETEKAGAQYIDITCYSRTAKDDPMLIAADGLHPSAKMYAGWVEMILPTALDILR